MKNRLKIVAKGAEGPEGCGSLGLFAPHGYALGHVLGRAGSEHLIVGFEQEAAGLEDVCATFLSQELSLDPTIVIAQGRAGLKFDQAYAGTATWQALHGLFWNMAACSALTHDQHVLFGAQAQVHLTDALHHLDVESAARVFATGVVLAGRQVPEWRMVFRGAAAVASLSRTLQSLCFMPVLPREEVDRHFAIDLFVPQFLGRNGLLCIQAKAVQENATFGINLDDPTSVQVEHKILRERMSQLDVLIGMTCHHALVSIGLTSDPPFMPSRKSIKERLSLFLLS